MDLFVSMLFFAFSYVLKYAVSMLPFFRFAFTNLFRFMGVILAISWGASEEHAQIIKQLVLYPSFLLHSGFVLLYVFCDMVLFFSARKK